MMAHETDIPNKAYSPKEIEQKWLDLIIKSKKITSTSKNYFSISIPPPNVTGNLHLGHALNTTIQDILVKYNMLKKIDTLWTIGTDHAGIATQLLVERSLDLKKINTKFLSREDFLNYIWEWKNENGDKILDQLRRLGLSCSWDHIKFTLDENLSNSVNEAFIRLFDKGLIYREKTLVNWDPKLKTAISDLEVISKNKKTKLYYFKYFVDNTNEFIIVSTTRPETVFGDVAIAINPKDKKNKKYLGRKILSPFNNIELSVIEDEYADIKKGSGAVKITPGHDFNDYKVAKNHNLELINILNDDGTLNTNVPPDFQNLSTIDARDKVLDLMKQLNLYVEEEDIHNTIPTGDRSGAIIEPMLKDQWFVNVKEMAYKSVKAVRNGDIVFKPKFWENTFFEWMEKIQPWCISRQIIWGHRIPIWYSDDNKFVAAKNINEAKEKFKIKYGKEVSLKQDEDVLDTWFSSGLWPFSTLGWPEDTQDFRKYFPTSILVTGFDIIFFWAARMIMMSLELTNQVPFATVYIHNLIRDEKSQKMSKTRGNVVDPLDLISEFGTDSLRFFLASNISPHSDIKLSQNSLEPSRNFMNKIWNASKFVQMNANIDRKKSIIKVDTFYDIWITSRFNELLSKYKSFLENCEVEKAAYVLYHFFWDEFCDWYIEIIKISFSKSETDDISNTKSIMNSVLYKFLNLLYPFAPFISIEIRNQLNFHQDTSLHFSDIPKPYEIKNEAKNVKHFKILQDSIIAIRSLRKNLSIPPGEKINCYYKTSPQSTKFIEKNPDLFLKLANLKSFKKFDDTSNVQLISNITSYGIISIEKKIEHDYIIQIKKLNKDLLSLQNIHDQSNKKLNNKGFLNSAPQEIVTKEKDRLDKSKEDINQIQNLLNQLS